MGDVTAISWTDHTFNAWIGCSKVHAGCLNCYAEADFDKRRHHAKWGPHGTRVLTSSAYWKKPYGWNREAERIGVRKKVFCSSLADVFEDWKGPITDKDGNQLFDVGDHAWRPADQINRNAFPGFDPSDKDFQLTMDDVRRRLFQVIAETPWLDWQLLTKRPENILRMWPRSGFPDAGVPGTLGRLHRIENAWLGTSISDQETAERAITKLLKCRDLSPVLFLSAEPLLGPIDLNPWIVGSGPCMDPACCNNPRQSDDPRYCVCHFGMSVHRRGVLNAAPFDWVIVGGESGPNARPNDIGWTESIIEQCQAAGVACFHKQLGSRSARVVNEKTRHLIIQDPKGGDPAEWPAHLRFRQFPQV